MIVWYGPTKKEIRTSTCIDIVRSRGLRSRAYLKKHLKSFPSQFRLFRQFARSYVCVNETHKCIKGIAILQNPSIVLRIAYFLFCLFIDYNSGCLCLKLSWLPFDWCVPIFGLSERSIIDIPKCKLEFLLF